MSSKAWCRAPLWLGSVLLLGWGLLAPQGDLAAQETTVRRAVPGPVATPNFLERALSRGWRSEDGSPGPNYWQQGVSYDLEARLDPETGRLEGNVVILWANNAPANLPTVQLHLHQNLHAEGSPRSQA